MHAGTRQHTRQWPLLLAVVIAQLLWMDVFLLSGTRALLLSIFLSHDMPQSIHQSAPTLAGRVPATSRQLNQD
ncbi:hypothetical protein SAMN05421819_4553 [Bryocella elongata]|uniref:Uncharacterized protein n=1 Tax=Bryocella elongata TaxID=863522 RepID=A0A1H6CGX0_9BACT|nr:hypothetical protein [Bryocella elongata]SEG72260.1 hypothetical protein SAMN05421819_4553 [Bryocella elongata]